MTLQWQRARNHPRSPASGSLLAASALLRDHGTALHSSTCARGARHVPWSGARSRPRLLMVACVIRTGLQLRVR